LTDRVGVLARGARIQFVDVYLDMAIRRNQESRSAFGQRHGATHSRVAKVVTRPDKTPVIAREGGNTLGMAQWSRSTGPSRQFKLQPLPRSRPTMKSAECWKRSRLQAQSFMWTPSILA